MNRSIFWRVFWKEYRLQRALWLAIAVLTMLLMLVVWEFVSAPNERMETLFRLALAFPALYCLGCGATLFAGEHEADTFDFQRSLPTHARWIFLGKAAFALLIAFLLFGLMWCVAALLNDWTVPDIQQQIGLWALFALLGLEMLVWTVLFSLWMKRVLVAAILGGGAAAAVFVVMTNLFGLTDSVRIEDNAIVTVPMRLLVVTAVALLDLLFGMRWFHVRRDRSMYYDVAVPNQATPLWAVLFSNRFVVDRKTVFSRLLWLHWRQSGWIMVGLAFLSSIVCLPIPHACSSCYGELLLYGAPISVCLLGVLVFHADQRGNSFRFLADRGISPNVIWLSRQVVPSCLLAAAFLTLSVGLAFFGGMRNGPSTGSMPMGRVVRVILFLFFWTAFLPAIAITAGQFWSMMIRSAIVACVFSFLLSAGLMQWVFLISWCHIDWLWAVLPIPIALLAATWLRTPYWLIERNTFRSWTPSVLVLAIPTFVLMIAVPLYRIYEIPYAEPPFPDVECSLRLTAKEHAAMDLYRTALSKYRSAQNDAAKQDAIAEMVKASQQEITHPLVDDALLRTVANTLQGHAEGLQKAGNLDAALDEYRAALHVSEKVMCNGQMADRLPVDEQPSLRVLQKMRCWADAPGQTPERLLAAEKLLRQWKAVDALRNRLKSDYIILRRILQGDLDLLAEMQVNQLSVGQMFWLRQPWERARAMRLLNLETQYGLQNVSELKPGEDLRLERFGTPPKWLEPTDSSLLLFLRARLAAGGSRSNNPYWRNAVWIPDGYYGVPSIARIICAGETAQNATRIVLVLKAWQLEHGSLPKTLDELVGHGLDAIPVDPYSGKPFRYVPEGRATPLCATWPNPSMPRVCDTPPHTPYLWATGLTVRCASSTDCANGIDGYEIWGPVVSVDNPGAWMKPTSEHDLWCAGWAFAIP